MVELKGKATCPICEKEENKYWIENYGMCIWCKMKSDEQKNNEYDKKEALSKGEISRDNSIMCPYCGAIFEDDIGELQNNDEFECDECEKVCDLSVDFTVHWTTSQKEVK